jgi:preprotein translocase subunit SecB
MTESISVAAVFTREASLRVPVRPWENALALRVNISIESTWRELPTPGHYAVVQTASAQAVNEAGVTCFEASVALELIGIVQGFAPEKTRDIVERYFPAVLFPHCRARLATLTLDTGYGVMHLPPMQASQVPPARPSNS